MASLNISTQRNVRLLCSRLRLSQLYHLASCPALTGRKKKKRSLIDIKTMPNDGGLIFARSAHTHTHIKCKSVGNIHNDKFSLNHSLLATATKLHLQFASDGVACLINGPLPHYGIFCLHLVKERSFSALLAWCLLHYTKYLSRFSTSLVSPLFWHLILPLFFSCASLSL